LFLIEIYYFNSTDGTSAFTESTETTVESTNVESTATAVESEVNLVDVPFPQDANATMANNANTFFMFFFFCLLMLIIIMNHKYTKKVLFCQLLV
jgi:hypothetical protein